ncbi:tRNA-dihydrouridine synthase A [Natronospira proteinivora]|uniref:tRNA-dihydrouridine(20/20a) synthase n=1 Tax=Natronospira proteinivora TaxID=1807133 RepID=A0ABT1G7U2_9GAMM|nr:tRNA dihydrouridine(20/20a) synthase DusA [Natronospira proteinivora]MCP1727015.1 tRNA-dihydrouridine synthase A [Natronospira proteinivora]
MSTQALDHRLSVAPMMDWTDRHFRYFLRLISRRVLLYTEMVHARAVIQGRRDRLLAFSAIEHPLALQLGGSEPEVLAEAARIAEGQGYDEVNLNVGCPSDRVQAGRFGACLMREPALVADCVAAMKQAVSIPVTVKCRIGVDDQDSDAALSEFLDTVSATSCRHFAVHARKAWLKGLSPKQNRDIPPLDFDRVRLMRHRFPQLEIVINGGIQSLDEAETLLDDFHGVMIGRAACSNPWMLAEADQRLFGDKAASLSRAEVAREYAAYCARMEVEGVPKSLLLRNIHGLFQGVPGARHWRRGLAENMGRNLSAEATVLEALGRVAEPDVA